MAKSKLTLSSIKQEFTSDIEVKIIKAVEAEQRASNRHLPLIKKVISEFIDTKDDMEVLKIHELYSQLYKLYKNQSYKQYSSYMKRVSVMGYEWVSYLLSDITEMKRNDIASALLPIDKNKADAIKISIYKNMIENSMDGISDKKLYLEGLLDSMNKYKFMIAKGEHGLVKTALISLYDKSNDNASDKSNDNASDKSNDNASDKSNDNQRDLRVDYIIEKISILDINQLDKVVNFLDHLI